MQRRKFIALLGGAAVACAFAPRVYPSARIRRIGILLGLGNDADAQVRVARFQQRLRQLGWVDGQTVQTYVRWISDDQEDASSCAHELADLAPDVLVSAGLPATAALHQQTRSTPIVFLVVPDPVANGFVGNLAKPESNLTGFANFDAAMGSKWLETLTEIAPRLTRVGLLFDPLYPQGGRDLPALAGAARLFGVELTPLPVRNPAEIEGAIAAFAREPARGLLVLPNTTVVRCRKLITSLAAQHGLPAVYPYRYFATCGGLVSYGMDTVELFSRAADYVDRILKGAKPAELPVQHPTKFELVINRRAAKALELDIPLTMLTRADEVIG